MLVDFFEVGLVNVRVVVGFGFVSVLMLVLDMLVVVRGVGVGVGLAVVLVLVGVGGFVGVLVGHDAPWSIGCWVVDSGLGCSGVSAWR